MPKQKYSSGSTALPRPATVAEQAQTLVLHLDRAVRQVLLAGEAPETGESFRRSEIAVVDTLGAEGPMTMGALAGRVRLPLSTATRLVDRLVERGVVQRDRPEENRRVVRVALAAAGRTFYDAAVRARIDGIRMMLERLTDEERREMVRLVEKIAHSFMEEADDEV